MSQLPRNADALMAMRKRRSRPDGLVLASLVGRLPYDNFALLAEPGQRYDWTPIAELELELVVDTTVPFPCVLQTLADIAEAAPVCLSLAYTEGPRIECGSLRRIEGMPMFDWYPLAIGPRHYAQAAKIARMLAQQLGKALPTPYDDVLALTAEMIEGDPQWHA